MFDCFGTLLARAIEAGVRNAGGPKAPTDEPRPRDRRPAARAAAVLAAALVAGAAHAESGEPAAFACSVTDGRLPARRRAAAHVRAAARGRAAADRRARVLVDRGRRGLDPAAAYPARLAVELGALRPGARVEVINRASTARTWSSSSRGSRRT
jgi:hypothetical protein